MKKLLILFAGMLFLAGCGGSGLSGDGEMVPLAPAAATTEPFDDGTGIVLVTVYGADGSVLEQGYYRNGLREGTYTVFHNNGLAKTLTGYVGGKKEGQELFINDRGQLEERYTYHNDQRHGPYMKFNRNRIKEAGEYKNGKLHGKLEKFYNNGKVMERSFFVEGKMHGIARWYDREGNNTIAYEYKDGELVGEVELEAAPEAAEN